MSKSKVSKSKKIILGKAIDGKKEKMSLQELKALSRQIRPHSEFNARPDIVSISRDLRENLTKAKSRMMDSLKKSKAEKDLKIYEYLLDDCYSVPSSPNLSSSCSSSDYDDEDDFSSVNTATSSSVQLRLVTSDSGSVSVVPSNIGHPLPLYTPDFSPSVIDMDYFFQSPISTPCTNNINNNDVTEDQINSWLQRGGFGDTMSPITMATDQELAGKFLSALYMSFFFACFFNLNFFCRFVRL